MLTLVTGASGFAGKHLVRDLINNGHAVIELDHVTQPAIEGVTETISCDLRDSEAVNNAVKSTKPEACIHLGAIAFVPAGNSDPGKMLSVNIHGTTNVLNAFKDYAPEAKILVTSTAHVYNNNNDGKEISEDDDLMPLSMYAISKAAADLATLAYASKYNMHCLTARPNNHTGPGQSPDYVVPSFARQLQGISNGDHDPVMHVGNLESIRDFSDVRDVVKAYRLLIESGRAGEAYNISSRKMLTINDVLSKLCEITGITPEIIVDQDKFRPTDQSPLLDISKLQKDTNWSPEIDFSETLKDMLAEI